MKCVICHGNTIEKKEVKEECLIGNDVIYVPLEVLECTTCGERYYDRNTKRYLEEIQQKVAEKKVGLKEIGKVMILAA
ncbi:MAG: YgiT-type zinc finger protein [Chitinivibrionales bacterium]|nr:YgiT-type zinc finger protein [Chitinivibrionales bacterium]